MVDRGTASDWVSFLSDSDGTSSAAPTGDIPDLITRIAQEAEVPPQIALSLAKTESGFNPKALGPATKYGRAQGLFQIMPAFLRDYGVRNPLDPEDNARGALRTLKQNFDRFGSWDLALAAHHAGAGAVAKAGGIPNTADVNMGTREYVQKILNGARDLGATDLPATGTAFAYDLGEDKEVVAAREGTRIARLEADPFRGFKKGIEQSKGLAGGATALIGDLLGSEDLKQAGLDYYQERMQAASDLTAPSDSLSEVLDGKGTLGQWVVGNSGYIGYQLLETIATGGLGAVVGRTTLKAVVEPLAVGMVAREASRLQAKHGATMAVEEIGERAIANTATKLGAGLGMFANNVRQEAGIIYPDAVEQGAEGNKLRILTASLGAAGIDTVADVFAGSKLLGLSERAAGGIGRRLATQVPTQMAVQGGTEVTQNIIENWGASKDPFREGVGKEWLDEGAVGALGGLFAGVGNAIPGRAPTAAVVAQSGDLKAAVDAPITPVISIDSLNTIRTPADDVLDAWAEFRRTAPIGAGAAIPADSPLAARMDDILAKAKEAGLGDDLDGLLLQRMVQATPIDEGAALTGMQDRAAADIQAAIGARNPENPELQPRVPPVITGPVSDGLQAAVPDMRVSDRNPAIPELGTTVPNSGTKDAALREEIRLMRERMDERAHEAAPSPLNDLPEPTQAQKDAGNYKLGHIRVSGLDISVENPQGSERKGVDRDGKAWSNTMQQHYGYIRGTVGRDKDHLDTFVKPGTPDDWTGTVFVVDQKEPTTGRFDEHKVMLGFDSQAEAEAAYRANYAADWQGLAAITPATMEQFKAWAYDKAATQRPYAYQETTRQGALALLEEAAAKETDPAVLALLEQGRQNLQKQAPPAQDAQKPAAPAENERAPTVEVMQQAIAKVGEARFQQLVADHMEQFDGEEMEAAERAAEVEAVARNVMDGAYDTVQEPAAPADNEQAPPDEPDGLTDAEKAAITARATEIERRKKIEESFARNREALPKFKVGQRVRWFSDGEYTIDGKTQKGRWFEGTIDKIADKEQGIFKVGNWSVGAASLESMEPAAPPAPPKLTAEQKKAREKAARAVQSEAFNALKGMESVYTLADKSQDEFEAGVMEQLAAWIAEQRKTYPEKAESLDALRTVDAEFWKSLQAAALKEKKAVEKEANKNRPKLKNTGIDLKRAWDEMRAKLKADNDVQGVTALNKVIAAATRADLFDVLGEDPTPGALVLRDYLRDNTSTFMQWLERHSSPLSSIYGSGYRDSYSSKLEQWVRGKATIHRQSAYKLFRGVEGMEQEVNNAETVGRDVISTVEQRIKAVAQLASEYIDVVQIITATIDGKTQVAPMFDALTEALFVSKPGRYVKQDDLTATGKRLSAGELFTLWSNQHRESNYAKSLIEKESTIEGKKRAQPMVPPRLERTTRVDLPETDRGNRNITPQEFKEAFGFADIGFGTWVQSKEDQAHLNSAYDAFSDLARHLGVDRKMIGMGGRLHFTLGALGQGAKAAATFHPRHPDGEGGTVQVINLTKTKGDGTVSHEWFHALDHFLQNSPGGQLAMRELVQALNSKWSFESIKNAAMSGLRNHLRMRGMSRTPVANALAIIDYYVNRPSSTTYKQNADAMDPEYWGNNHEMRARAFEAWVSDTIGGTNNYLVNPLWVGDGLVKPPTFKGTPYPAGDERKTFANWFNALRASLYSTDSGVPIVNVDRWQANKPKDYENFLAQVEELKADIPLMYEQMKLAEAAERRAKEEAVNEAMRAKREAEAAERRAAEKAAEDARKREEAAANPPPPAPPPAGPLSDDDLDALFDDAAESVKAEGRENITAPAPGDSLVEGKTLEKTPKARTEPGRQPPESAGKLLAKAAELGVKGADEALTGLAKLFGGGPGKLQSFPGNLDEETYNKAKPHFEAALKAFQEAGKTLKDLFKLLIEQFGEGVKPYAIRFAKDMKLGASLGEDTNGTKRLANWVQSQLDDGIAMDWRDLFAQADEAFGGTQAEGKYTPKDAYDAAEAGMNRWIRAKLPLLADPRAMVGRLNEVVQLLPTQTKRTKEQDEFQQFSTVPALAWVANWVANVQVGETYMEPSAGVGGLAVFGDIAGAKIVANELSSRRAAVLRDVLPNAQVFSENAEYLNDILPQDIRPTVIVMNPPFSATAGRVEGQRDTMNGARHIESALDRLAPGGRLVAIVGKGMSDSEARFKPWWNDIRSKYTVRANISVNGAEYAKYGTTYDNNLLVIDKTGPTSDNALLERRASGLIGGRAEAYAELPALLEGVRNDRTKPSQVDLAPESASDQPAGGGATAPGMGDAGATPPVVTGAVGTGTGIIPGGRGQTGAAGNAGRPGAGVPGAGRGNRNRRDDNGATGQPGAGGADAAGERAGNVDTEVEAGEGAAARAATLTESVYEQYAPQKAILKGSKPHPGKLVESAAMAAVEPLDVTYTPNLPREAVVNGLLSDAQIEAVIYAGQAHQQTLPSGERRGYFIGDGTGVGKGREISGIILDNIRQGRKKHLWVSAKTGLAPDARRDFSGIGGNPNVIFELAKTGVSDKVAEKDGIMFLSYDTLRGKEKTKDPKVKPRTRLDQVVEWVGPDFDGVIAFDESHKMGNMGGQKTARGDKDASQMALMGAELSKLLPKARVVYVSATGATEVANLMYASRLGLWGEKTPFASSAEFSNQIGAAGLASMELVARDMKAMGSYIARGLSFDGVEYEKLDVDLSPLQIEIYNELARAWQVVLQNVNEALKTTNQSKNGQARGQALSRFWGTHQRFFNQIITSMQTPAIIDRAQKELASGNSVVFQLVNTNEAALDRELDKARVEGTDLEELDFTPRQTLIEYVKQGFPVQKYEEYKDPDTGKVRSRPVVDSEGKPVLDQNLIKKRDELVKTLQDIRVPDNPIDLIIQAFGEENTAEVTGRSRRTVTKVNDKGEVKVVEQKRGANSNRADADAFMAGKKRALIFSDAGGTGYSFHSDLGAKNKQRRAHFLVQPGWRADNAVQGFGRTHRSNEANQPVYVLPQTKLKAQKRFISSIARRLDQLGALTKGQRNTAGGGMFSNRDNLESKYAVGALRSLLTDWAPSNRRAVSDGAAEAIDTTAILTAMGLEGIYDPKTGGIIESAMPTMPRFLNRLMSLTVDQQDIVFGEFELRMDAAIESAIEKGTYDDGMQTVKALKVRKLRDEVVNTDERTGAATRFIQLELTKQTVLNDWAAVQSLLEQYPGKGADYYLDNRTGQPFVVVNLGSKTNADGTSQARGYRFNIKANSAQYRGNYILNRDTIENGGGPAVIKRDDGEVRLKRYEKITNPDIAEYLWNDAYDSAPRTETEEMDILAGALLPVWDRIHMGDDSSATVVRTLTDDGERLIGRVIPSQHRTTVLKNFGVGAISKDIPAAKLIERIMRGETAILANGWSLQKAMVSGENRIELLTRYLSSAEQRALEEAGGIVERIGWRERFFVPEAKFDALTRDAGRPVVDFTGGKNLESDVVSAATLPFFRDLYPGEANVDEAVERALDLLPFNSDVRFEKVNLPDKATVPLRFGLIDRVVQYNTASPYHSLALDIQVLIEEFWHAADSVGGEATISASMTRLLPGGDLRAELDAAFEKSAMLKDFLRYPLDRKRYPKLSDSRVQSELFARLGVFYTAHRDVLAQVAPKLTEAYDDATGQFNLDAGTAERSGVSLALSDSGLGGRGREGGGETARGYWAVGNEVEWLDASLGGDLRGSPGSEPTDRLEEFRRRSAAAFGGDVAGAPVDFSAASAPAVGQTTTQAFRDWFGDSKVVDADGSPLRVYHGTASDFDRFAIPRESSIGIWFTADPDTAARYANIHGRWKEGEQYGGRGDNIVPVYLSLQNPAPEPIVFGLTKESARRSVSGKDRGSILRNMLIERGYDGMLAGDTFVAFRPEQIKSAVGNRGTFDPDSANILESRITEGALADAWPLAARKAHDFVYDAVAGSTGKIGLWGRTVGTQMDKARNNPTTFGPVFQRAQKFIDDISRIALKAEGLAPSILPKVGGLRDVPNAIAQALGKRGMTPADNQLLGQMLTEGTIAGQELDDYPSASPFLGKVWTVQEMRERFGATDEQIELYREARRAIDQALDDAGRATMLASMRAAKLPQSFIDAMEMRTHTPDEMRTLAVDQLRALSDPDDEAAREAISEFDARLKAIAENAVMLQNAGYAPLMRFGKHYLTARGSDGKAEFFGRYESMAELQRAKREIRNEHPDWTVEAGELSMEGFKNFEGLDVETVMLFARAAGFEDEALQKFYEIAVSDRSALKRLIHRKGTAGYSLDARRSLAAFLTSNARYASKMLNAPVMRQLVEDIKDGAIKDEAHKLVEFTMNPKEEAAAIRGLMFTWYLGGSLASGFVNMTQPVLMTFPYLARFGTSNAAKAMKDGMKATAAYMRDKTVGDAELAAALEKAKDEGITSPSEIHALMAASRGAFQSPAMQAFHTTWGANFALTESFNRTLSFASSFLAARANGDANPYAFAKKAVYDTQGLYTRANRPNWARGAIGAVLFTFKQFSIAYIEFLKQLVKDGTIPKTQLGIALGMLFIGAGLQGLPGAEDMDDIIDALGQWMGFATNTTQWKRRALESVLGETLGAVAMYGITTQMGLDLQGRLGMGNLIPGTGLLVPSNPNKGRDAGEFFGPFGGLVKSGTQGLERLFRGDLGGAASAVLPAALRNAVAGSRMLVTGEARDTMGRRVTDVGPVEAVGKIAGFNPQRVATESRLLGDFRADENILRERSAAIRELWASGVANDDQDAIDKARRDLRQWNERNPELRIDIRPRDVMLRAKQMRETRAARFVRSTPKSMRDRARDLLEETETADDE